MTTSSHEKPLSQIISKKDMLAFQNLVLRVPVADNVVEFAVDLASATRPQASQAPTFIQEWIEWGAGPRASQYLILGAKAKAVLDGRPSPSIKDVEALALPVLRHRVIPNFNAEAEGMNVDSILTKLISAGNKA
jgi:MoxR-like ATPase